MDCRNFESRGFREFAIEVEPKVIKKIFEEEKKMLNVDRYREEIDRIIENGGVPRYMLLRMCLQKTNLESIDTAEVLDWLFSEYEPPLLENGDGLKPGDWIMVRDVDSQSFVRRQFLYFFDGKFICSAPNHAPLEGFGEPWVQACLPEDGEKQ